jgi:hypothetical protein
MAWIKVHDSAPNARPCDVVVSMMKAPSSNVAALRIRLGRLAEQAFGVREGQSLELLCGTEEQAGWVLVRPAEEGATLLRQKNVLEITLGHLPVAPLPGPAGVRWTLEHRRRPAVPQPEGKWRFEPAEGGLAVELPREWWSVGDEAASAVTAAVTAPAPALAPAPAVVAPPAAEPEPEPVAPTPPPAPKAAAPAPKPATEPEDEDPLVAKAMALLASRDARPAAKPAPAPVPPSQPLGMPAQRRPEASRPPRPVEDDKIEKAIRLIAAGKLDSEVINAVRCTPAFLADCKAELSRRRREAGRAAA